MLDPESFYALLGDGAWIEAKASRGGTGSAAVSEQLAHVRRATCRRSQRAPWRRAARAEMGWGHKLYGRPVLDVAEALIGCVVTDGECSGVIVGTEAYHDSRAGLARVCRPEAPAQRDPVRGPPGRAYVYLSYGVHTMLNAVCEPEGVGAAVLIRALGAN